jgi:tetratricopeptide (TPR) repeat protein
LFYVSNIILSLPWATFGSFELRSDRYNYLACLGVFAIIAALPGYLAEKKPGLVGTSWALIVGLGLIWLFTAGARIRDWKDTITLIESALATTGDNFGKAYLWRGTILADQGKGDPALQDFNKAMNKNPLLYDAYKYRGNIMGLRKNYEQSVVDLSRYIDHYPEAAPEIYNRGLSYVNLGKDAEALADFNRCLEIDPNFVRAYRARGNTYLKMGETEKGNADLQTYDRLSGK